MPISSAAKKATGAVNVNRSQQSNWSTSRTKSLGGASSDLRDTEKPMSSFQKKSQSTSSKQQQQQQQQAKQQSTSATKFKSIKHISAPSSAAATSAASLVDLLERKVLSNESLHHSDHEDNLSEDDIDDMQPTSMNIGGHLVLTGGKQPNSIGTIMNLSKEMHHHQSSRGVDIGSGKSYLACNSQYQSPSSKNNNSNQQQSRLSLNQPSTTTNSTAHLHSLSNLRGSGGTTHPLSIKRNVNLKYVKTLIIVLMGIDLLITVLVHQFATQDQISIWFTSYKIRFSILNLVLSAIWFIVLIGAILFDILFILIIGCLVDISSLALLFVLSIVHFTQRIDYNSVNLTSLLGLLFGITILHVYMIVMTTLTIYLMLAVKRRRSSSSVN